MFRPSTRAGVWAKPCPAPTHSTAVAKAIATKHKNYDLSANADWIEPGERACINLDSSIKNNHSTIVKRSHLLNICFQRRL